MERYETWTTEEALKRAWHPKILALHEYWKSIHPQEGLPSRRDLDPIDIPQLLPSIWLLDVQRDPWRFRYRLMGSRIVATMEGQRNYTGRWLDEVHPNFRSEEGVEQRYVRVAAEGRPSWRQGQPSFRLVRDWVSIQNVVLPLASDHVQVDMLLCGSVMLNAKGEEQAL
ncbi:MAG: PAS domain-containing protein [Alphaproteobacteria bacterium]|nr:PAS domain-containing protein [Alphaproteobacteria bacterium]